MNTVELVHVSKEAINIATEVGSFLASQFSHTHKPEYQAHNHLHIALDEQADQLYQTWLQSTFPKHNFITEERRHNHQSDYTWYIDAIEGTTNFARQIPVFATQICLVHQGEIVLSVIYAPLMNLKFHSIQGQGAWCNQAPLLPSNCSKLSHSVVSCNRGHTAEHKQWWGQSMTALSKVAKSVRNFGATGLDLAFVASGKLDAHCNFGSHQYDMLPGIGLIIHSGSVACNLSGDVWKVGDNSLIAGNDQIVPKLYQVLENNNHETQASHL